MDCNLSFRQQLKSLETKIARAVGILYKLKYLLPESAMLNLYYALVRSNLVYGILLWGNTFPSNLTKLSKIAKQSYYNCDWGKIGMMAQIHSIKN